MRQSLYNDLSQPNANRKTVKEPQLRKSLYAADVDSRNKIVIPSRSTMSFSQDKKDFGKAIRPTSAYAKILQKNSKTLQREFESPEATSARRLEHKLNLQHPELNGLEREAFKVLIYIVRQIKGDGDKDYFYSFMQALTAQSQ